MLWEACVDVEKWDNTEHLFFLFFFLQTDAHYSVLSLLLFLSGSPSNTDFTERPRVKEAGEFTGRCSAFRSWKFLICVICLYAGFAEQEDAFDWAGYLMEGEDIDTGPFPDTPVSQS